MPEAAGSDSRRASMRSRRTALATSWSAAAKAVAMLQLVGSLPVGEEGTGNEKDGSDTHFLFNTKDGLKKRWIKKRRAE